MVFGFARWQKAEPAAPTVPRGVRVYAIGDIHGRLDLLDRLHQQILDDARMAEDRVRYLVYLGDYIDRGAQSSGVIERLSAGPLPGFGAIHIKGNHEATLLDALDDAECGRNWLHHGGIATLASYGIAPPDPARGDAGLALVQDQLRHAVPAHHWRFLLSLRLSVTIGDYHFVHAGVRPGVPLNRQHAMDSLWIRDDFLKSTADFGKVVVHGHTARPEPDIRTNRIGIDTGAFATHRLTCLVLEGSDRRFLATA